MVQYQTFPDAVGNSHTLEKLKALHLPLLAGRSFLDVGCNEGFFCGFARFGGAERVVGIDHSRAFVERARLRFPNCEFHHQGWDRLPDERFDIILLASALHYADDQPALIRALVDRLSDDGVLVLELGIVSSPRPEWRSVERGIDERLFPSMPMLREVLSGYAWKWMGPSISQAGDPVPRHVIHICRRRPVAYLLTQPPGYGKSSLASGLFPKAGVPVVSGDQRLSLVARGKAAVSPALKELVDREFSPFRIDQFIQRVFELELGDDLVSLWLDGLADGDVAVDAYVPNEFQARVGRALEQRGYMPVHMCWDRIGPAPMPAALVAQQGEAFYLSLTGDPAAGDAAVAYRGEPAGHVDEIRLDDGKLAIRGWSVDEQGNLPPMFSVRIGCTVFTVDSFERQLRPDVQRHLGLPHALVGYRLLVEAAGVRTASDLGSRFQVSADGRRALTLSGAPAAIFQGGAS